MNVILLAIFLISCVTITVFFTKKKIDFARAAFLVAGIYIGSCFLFFLCVNPALETETIKYFRLDLVYSCLMPIATLIYGVTAVVVIFAAAILSVFAIHKIAEYIGETRTTAVYSREQKLKLFTEETSRHKIFAMLCRWID